MKRYTATSSRSFRTAWAQISRLWCENTEIIFSFVILPSNPFAKSSRAWSRTIFGLRPAGKSVNAAVYCTFSLLQEKVFNFELMPSFFTSFVSILGRQGSEKLNLPSYIRYRIHPFCAFAALEEIKATKSRNNKLIFIYPFSVRG